ncbi:MAG: serine protease [Thermoleophilia bacterium]
MRLFRHLVLLSILVAMLAAALPAAAAQPHVRVVGGQPVAMTDMPWAVYLEADLGAGNSWSCGGTIVGPHFILTAAHCVVDKQNTIKPGQISGVAGRADLRSADGTEFDVVRIAVNPSYNRTRGSEGGPGDAALLWTSVDLPYAPLPLATTADAPFYAAGVMARIAGWGLTSASGGTTEVLLTASVPIVSDAECSTSDQVSIGEAQAMVCAGFAAGGIDSCQGDSGGPLTVLNGSGATILAGVVSWGYECAAAGRPGLYTRVATLTSWITPLLTGDEKAWSAAADQSPPRVRMSRTRMDAKSYAKFTYRILGETGPTRETISIRRTRGGTVLKRFSTKVALNPPGKNAVVSWRVPNSLPFGAYVWCMTSRDASGNTSALQCAPFAV